MNNLKAIRWSKGLTVTQLGKKSHVSHSTITKIENENIMNFSLYTAYRIADALDMSVYDVFPRE